MPKSLQPKGGKKPTAGRASVKKYILILYLFDNESIEHTQSSKSSY